MTKLVKEKMYRYVYIHFYINIYGIQYKIGLRCKRNIRDKYLMFKSSNFWEIIMIYTKNRLDTEVLLYSTGRYIQYLGIEHDGI